MSGFSLNLGKSTVDFLDTIHKSRHTATRLCEERVTCTTAAVLVQLQSLLTVDTPAACRTHTECDVNVAWLGMNWVAYLLDRVPSNLVFTARCTIVHNAVLL